MSETLHWIGGVLHAHGPDERPGCEAHMVGLCIVNSRAQPAPDPLREAALAAIDKAWDTVTALCEGKMRWEMRVPAEPDRDPDLVIGEALRLARAALAAPARPDVEP